MISTNWLSDSDVLLFLVFGLLLISGRLNTSSFPLYCVMNACLQTPFPSGLFFFSLRSLKLYDRRWFRAPPQLFPFCCPAPAVLAIGSAPLPPSFFSLMRAFLKQSPRSPKIRPDSLLSCDALLDSFLIPQLRYKVASGAHGPNLEAPGPSYPLFLLSVPQEV